MADTYKPRPGSTADKILTFLAEQPRGTEFTTPELIERSGINTRDIISLMRSAVRCGIVRSRVEPHHILGSVTHWSMPPSEGSGLDMGEYPAWMICSPVRLPMRADARWLA